MSKQAVGMYYEMRKKDYPDFDLARYQSQQFSGIPQPEKPQSAWRTAQQS